MPAGIVRRRIAGFAKKGKGNNGPKRKSIWDANDNTQTKTEGGETSSVFKGNVAPRAVPPPRSPMRTVAIYGGLVLACGLIGAFLWLVRPPERSYDPDSLSRSMTSGASSPQRSTAQMYPGSSEAIRSERSTTGERTDQSFLDTPYRKGSGAVVAGGGSGGSSGGGRQSGSGHSTGGSAKSYGGGDGASVVADRRTNSCVVRSDGAAGFADALSNCIQGEKK
ncbi:MAG TPA: hypothetical protein VI279_10840 [Rhodocyclaceae bacterium]